MSAVTKLINDLTSIDGNETDVERKSRLLTILAGGLLIMTVLVSLWSGASLLVNWQQAVESGSLYIFITTVVTGTVLVGIHLINRYVSQPVAGAVFTLALIVIFSLADTPEQVSNGRTLLAFVIPIIMAGYLLRPYATFVAAALSALIVAGIAISIGLLPNVTAIAVFFAVALVTWLAASNLEHALHRLQEINRNLDGLVVERTFELERTLAEVEVILQSIADGVAVFDKDGHAFRGNQSFVELVGQPLSRIRGQKLDSIMGDAVAAEDRARLLTALREQDRSRENMRLGWGGRTLSVSFATLRGREGKVVVLRDYTAEAEVERMKDAFLSMASHELRTPLNAILGYADMLKLGAVGPVNATQTDILQRMISNVRRMTNLVNNLLDSARIEAGKLEPRLSPFDLRALAEDIDGTMRVLAEQKGLTMHVNVAGDLPPQVVSDRERLTQVLINLMGNAIKFTDEGSVTLAINCRDDHKWAISVRDTGIGISEADQQRIFEPFAQAESPYTRKEQGTGLGLSIVRQLVELMDGTISVESSLGKGSTFTLVFPYRGA
ncbi:MAG: PAS domain-containing protein [Chloroflexi bacterium]|nr:PAS domain-containing protein [Chloroflexota bacterium]